MATLAQGFRSARPDEGSGAAQTAGMTGSEPGMPDVYRLRPLPYEDMYLHVKRFDNTQVVRKHDPRAGRTAWKAIGASSVAAAMLIGLLAPGAYRLLAGYQIDRLRQAQEQSIKELKTLEYEEARLVTLDRMVELAKSKEMAAPTSDQVQFVQPKDSVAQLQEPRQ